MIPPAPGTISRRRMLTLIGLAAGVTGLPALAGCAGQDGAAPSSGAPSGTPTPGGTVRLAFAGGGATETLDPHLGTSPADLARSAVVFDQLFVFSGGRPVPRLAESVDTEPDGSAFTLHLRDGVTWHDGSPFTAADVVHTLALLVAPERPFPSELAAYADLAGATALDERTVRVTTLQPVGDPATQIAAAGVAVVRQGTRTFDATTAIGTGPYRVTAFQAGVETRLARFDECWDGPPNADELVLLSIDDPQARVNAVAGGQADYASDVPYTTAKAGAPGAGLEVRAADAALRTSYGFVLNTTRPLPADERVRLALRLGVDRQALVDTVFLGFGEVANDLFGAGAMHYEDAPVLGRDVDRARRLLDEAGATGQPFVIRTAEYEVGLNASAELFAQQLRELGLEARAQPVGLTEFFAVDGLAQSDAVSFPLGPFSLAVTYTRSAAYEALAFPDDELSQAVATAMSTTSDDERATAWQAAQAVMADRGNWVVWGRGDVLSIARDTLAGVEARESPKYPWLGRVGFTA